MEPSTVIKDISGDMEANHSVSSFTGGVVLARPPPPDLSVVLFGSVPLPGMVVVPDTLALAVVVSSPGRAVVVEALPCPVVVCATVVAARVVWETVVVVGNRAAVDVPLVE